MTKPDTLPPTVFPSIIAICSWNKVRVVLINGCERVSPYRYYAMVWWYYTCTPCRKKEPTLARPSSELHGRILKIFGSKMQHCFTKKNRLFYFRQRRRHGGLEGNLGIFVGGDLSACTANVRVQSSSVAFTVQIPQRCELTGLYFTIHPQQQQQQQYRHPCPACYASLPATIQVNY